VKPLNSELCSAVYVGADGAAMIVTEPLGMLWYQAGLPGYRSGNQLQVLQDFVAVYGFANAKAGGYEAVDFLAAAVFY
jgi:hypothetical protein